MVIKDVTNGTEVDSKFYSYASNLSLQTVIANNPTNINEYFSVFTSQGKSLSLPTHYTNITFIDSLGTSYIPTSLSELYSYSSLITGLTVNGRR